MSMYHVPFEPYFNTTCSCTEGQIYYGFTMSSYSVTEGETVTLVLEVNEPLPSTTTFSLSVSTANATQGQCAMLQAANCPSLWECSFTEGSQFSWPLCAVVGMSGIIIII